MAMSDVIENFFRLVPANSRNLALEEGVTLKLDRNVKSSGAALALTAADSGAYVRFDTATSAVTLPALATAEIGVYFDFLVVTTATAQTITAQAGDILTGGVSIMSTGAGVENDAFSADGSDDLIMTMNGTTQGGIIGSWVRFTAGSATRWDVQGGLIGSGTLVTPFS